MQWRVILAAGEEEENIEYGQRMEKYFHCIFEVLVLVYGFY
jgi:hypothetical protein